MPTTVAVDVPQAVRESAAAPCNPQDGPTPDACRRLLADHHARIGAIVRQVARRHRLSPDDAEELRGVVWLRLLDRDCAVVRKFRGESAFSSYLTLVISRMCLDWCAAEWGRWRPSAEARRLGAVAIELERLTTRDGLTFDEACESIRTTRRATVSQGELERLRARLPARARRTRVSDRALLSLPVPDQRVGDDQSDLLEIVQRAVEVLSARDRYVIVRRFHHRWTAGAVAAELGIATKVVYRIQERAIRQLRQILVN